MVGFLPRIALFYVSLLFPTRRATGLRIFWRTCMVGRLGRTHAFGALMCVCLCVDPFPVRTPGQARKFSSCFVQSAGSGHAICLFSAPACFADSVHACRSSLRNSTGDRQVPFASFKRLGPIAWQVPTGDRAWEILLVNIDRTHYYSPLTAAARHTILVDLGKVSRSNPRPKQEGKS